MKLLRRSLVGPVIAALLLGGTFGARPALADGVVGDGNPAHCTEAAFDSALAMGGLITFNCGPAPKTIVFSNTKIIFTNITIDGGGLITLSGGNNVRLFSMLSESSLTLQNIVLEDGNSLNAAGGAIYDNLSVLSLDHTTIQNSRTSNQDGGAIEGNGGAITLTHSLIQDNSGFADGAIHTTGSLALNDSTIRNNTAANTGGALAVNGATVINHSQIYSNSANGVDVGGAGLYLGAASVVGITDTQIYSNTAFVGFARGGGIKNYGALTVHQSSLSGNYAYSGGGLSNESGAAATLDQVTFTGNSASEGGALYNEGTLSLTQAALSANLSISGGGLKNAGGTTTLLNSTLAGNRSEDGGGIYNSGGGLTLINDTLSGNVATESGFGNGGGLASISGTVSLTNLTLSGNTAILGGGLYIKTTAGGASLTLRNTLVADSLAGGNCAVDAGSLASITSAGFNLSSDNSCLDYFTQGGDQNGQPARLLALANNGGLTLTHLPQHDSPAIDNGTGAGCPATDQRGRPRPQGAACDVGAVEVQPGDRIWPLFLAAVRR